MLYKLKRLFGYSTQSLFRSHFINLYQFTLQRQHQHSKYDIVNLALEFLSLSESTRYLPSASTRSRCTRISKPTKEEKKEAIPSWYVSCHGEGHKPPALSNHGKC